MVHRPHRHMATRSHGLEKYAPYLIRVRELDAPGEVTTSLEKRISKQQRSGGAEQQYRFFSAQVRSVIHRFFEEKIARKRFLVLTEL